MSQDALPDADVSMNVCTAGHEELTRTNVAVVVDGHATNVHRHTVALVRAWSKVLLATAHGVMQLQLCSQTRHVCISTGFMFSTQFAC